MLLQVQILIEPHDSRPRAAVLTVLHQPTATWISHCDEACSKWIECLVGDQSGRVIEKQ